MQGIYIMISFIAGHVLFGFLLYHSCCFIWRPRCCQKPRQRVVEEHSVPLTERAQSVDITMPTQQSQPIPIPQAPQPAQSTGYNPFLDPYWGMGGLQRMLGSSFFGRPDYHRQEDGESSVGYRRRGAEGEVRLPGYGRREGYDGNETTTGSIEEGSGPIYRPRTEGNGGSRRQRSYSTYSENSIRTEVIIFFSCITNNLSVFFCIVLSTAFSNSASLLY